MTSKILFPLAVAGALAAEVFAGASYAPSSVGYALESQDTVVYEPDAYKLNRRGSFGEVKIADSLLAGIADTLELSSEEDTPVILARDTIKIPDSLQYTDPWRYKFYLALVDSLTHVQVCDSLLRDADSLILSYRDLMDQPDSVQVDTLAAFADSLLSLQDRLDAHLVDSVYLADSAALARAKFLEWYAGLSKEERKKYDFEQKELRKMAVQDSLREVREERKAIKDSTVKATPRILETYALSGEMHYERIVAWNYDYGQETIRPFVPDTSFNARYYDQPFRKRDVNATWLGVDGSPVQYYDWSKRRGGSNCVFYENFEPWTYTPKTFLQYNTKSPYTELCYYGTLLSTGAKEQDNVRFLCTQNITPALNFQLLFERFGGGGMLINETFKNKTFAAGINHMGKRYVMSAGFISNNVAGGENGGIKDLTWVRDTTVESREIPVYSNSAASQNSKSTWYIQQQYMVDSALFIGNDVEWSRFQRQYAQDGKNFTDSMDMKRLDVRAYARLQPWGPDALLSKVDVGVGDYLHRYLNQNPEAYGTVSSNSVYAYASASGKFRKYIDWGASGKFVFAGADTGDTYLDGNVSFKMYPFRKARTSPLSLDLSAGTSVRSSTFYQRHSYSKNADFCYDVPLDNTSELHFKGALNIPYWKFGAGVGYNLVSNQVYYQDPGKVAQCPDAVSVLSASLKKNFCIGGWLHLDNDFLFQFSSDQTVAPVPAVAANLRYYAQFVVQKAEDGKSNVMVMQLGVNLWANTPWNAPGWCAETGRFYNQTSELYTNGPWFDVFMNIQWKKACIFVRMQNLGQGWPMEQNDYFSAHRRIVTMAGMPGLKIGITWPFYPDAPMRKAVR